MKPADVASQLGVAPVTIRAWSNEFAVFMSPTGAGGEGRHRDFTQTDIQIMSFVKGQRAIGRKRDEIALALREMLEAGSLDSLPFPAERVGAEVMVVPGVLVDETRRSMMRENAVLSERIEKLEQQLENERGESRALLRELADLNGKLQRALLVAELYESGRLKTDS